MWSLHGFLAESWLFLASNFLTNCFIFLTILKKIAKILHIYWSTYFPWMVLVWNLCPYQYFYVLSCLFVFQWSHSLIEIWLSRQFQSEDGCLYATSNVYFLFKLLTTFLVHSCRSLRKFYKSQGILRWEPNSKITFPNRPFHYSLQRMLWKRCLMSWITFTSRNSLWFVSATCSHSVSMRTYMRQKHNFWIFWRMVLNQPTLQSQVFL